MFWNLIISDTLPRHPDPLPWRQWTALLEPVSPRSVSGSWSAASVEGRSYGWLWCRRWRWRYGAGYHCPGLPRVPKQTAEGTCNILSFLKYQGIIYWVCVIQSRVVKHLQIKCLRFPFNQPAKPWSSVKHTTLIYMYEVITENSNFLKFFLAKNANWQKTYLIKACKEKSISIYCSFSQLVY